MKPIFKRIASVIFSRKTLIRLVFTVIVLLTLLMIFHRVETWRGRNAWNEYQKTAIDRGTQLWLREFVTPSIPAEQNFAAIPFFAGRFGTAEESKAAEGMLPPASIGSEKRPLAGGKATDFIAWRDYLAKANLIASPTDNAARDVVAALDRSLGLQQIRAAANRAKCKFPVDIEKGFATVLPHMSAVQAAAFYLSLDAEARLSLDDASGAFKDIEVIIRIADACRDEPYLIALLARVSVLQKAIGAIQAGLVHGAWKDEQLAVLDQVLATQILIPGIRFAMASERATMTTELDRLATNPSYQSSAIWQSMGTTPNMSYVFPRGWFYMNMVKGNEIHDRIAEAYAKEADAIRVSPNTAIAKELDELRGLDRYRYVFIYMLMPALDSVEKSVLFVQSQVAQARIAIALERSKLTSGNYVNNLVALLPFVVPKDPCDGQPMRYVKTENGYKLWSVGINRVDDNALRNPKITNPRDQPDWVWKFER